MTTTQEAGGPGWSSMRVMLAPGSLLVAREGPGLLVSDPQGEAQESTTDKLLELCSGPGRTTPAPSGEALVRAVAALLATIGPADVPALALVTVEGEDLLVTLTRGMRLAVTDASGATELLDAASSLLPVNRVLGPGVAAVAIGPDPEHLDADRRSNLSGGVVRAGGLLLEPGPPQEEGTTPPETLVDLTPPPPAPAQPAPTFTTFSLHDDEPVVTDDASRVEPEPVAVSAGGTGLAAASQASVERQAESMPTPAGEEEAGPVGEVMVRGIVCSRGHFNPPDARFCERCGISTVHQTHNVVTGIRPPLGVLVLDDGVVHPLAGDLVIGRAPEEADEVRSGRSTALALDDPELSLSRTHARLVLDGWEVRVEDAGSVNGTFLAEAGSEDWSRLEAGRPTTITPGARLRMGSRVLSFESHHRV